MDSYIALGIMSGTSLDGLDLALCRFWQNNTTAWDFSLLKSHAVAYSREWQQRLREAHLLSAIDHFMLERDFTRYVIGEVQAFLKEVQTPVTCIGFHGHTIYHQPNQGVTVQMGNGALLATHTQITTVCDFRRNDLALGGEGAPLVPIGDKLLFNNNKQAWLNLGGIANISYDNNGITAAHDICFCNMLLNTMCHSENILFDKDGLLARNGKIDPHLLASMEEKFSKQIHKKQSLGKELFEQFYPEIIKKTTHNLNHDLRTAVEHIAIQICKAVPRHITKTMVTGGGAHHQYLIERMNAMGVQPFEIAPSHIIDFKEAIIFAFLAVLRLRGENNALATVTKACRDSCGGAIYVP